MNRGERVASVVIIVIIAIYVGLSAYQSRNVTEREMTTLEQQDLDAFCRAIDSIELLQNESVKNKIFKQNKETKTTNYKDKELESVPTF